MGDVPDIAFTAEQRAHLAAVQGMLAGVYRRSGREAGDEVETRTPLSELIEREEGEPEDYYAAGVHFLRKFLAFVFQRGPEPAAALQNLFVVARAMTPELVLNMSGEEVALIFGQGRAAESARMVLLNKRLAAAGFCYTTFRHQKSETARAKMARAQRGNHNRKGGRKVA